MSQINIDTSKYYAIIARHSGLCLDVEGADLKGGAKLVQYQYSASNNQLWKLKPTKDGSYNIIAKHSDKCLGLIASFQEKGQIIQWNWEDCDNQKWSMFSVGDGYYNLVSKYSGLILSEGGLFGGGLYLDDIKTQSSSSFSMWKPILVGNEAYKIVYKASKSSFCLTVEKGLQSNGATVICSPYEDTNNQKWVIFSIENKFYKIVAKHSDKCLTAADPSILDGVIIRQLDCDDSLRQKWRVIPVEGEYYKIESVHSGKCLDVEGGYRSSGDIIQYEYNGGKNQQWKLVPATNLSF